MQKFSIKIIFIILFLFIISYLLLFISRLGSKNIDNHYADNMGNQENVQKSDASDEEDIDTSGTDGMGEESGIRIMIDPGHQLQSDYTKEQKGPDTDIVGTKVSQGTRGTFTGLWEYELNLIVGLKLSEILVSGNASPTERYWYRNLKREPDIKNNGNGYSLKEPWLKDLGERLSDYIRDYKN